MDPVRAGLSVQTSVKTDPKGVKSSRHGGVGARQAGVNHLKGHVEQTAEGQMLRRAAGVDSDGPGMIKRRIRSI